MYPKYSIFVDGIGIEKKKAIPRFRLALDIFMQHK